MKPERIVWEGKVSCKFYNHNSEDPFFSTRAINIGYDGLLFFSRDPIPADSILVVKLYSYKDYAPVKILVKVRTTKMNEAEDAFEVDCQYHDLSPADHAAVEEIVEEVDFINRIHKKVQKTLQENGVDLEPKPAAEKHSGKHGSKRA